MLNNVAAYPHQPADEAWVFQDPTVVACHVCHVVCQLIQVGDRVVHQTVSDHVADHRRNAEVCQHCCKLFVSVGANRDVLQTLEAVHFRLHLVEDGGYVGGDPLLVIGLVCPLGEMHYVLGAGHPVRTHESFPVTRKIKTETSTTRGTVPVWANVQLDPRSNDVIDFGTLRTTFKTLVVPAAHVVFTAAHHRDVLAVLRSPDFVSLDVLAATHAALHHAHVFERVTYFDLPVNDGLNLTLAGKRFQATLSFPEAVIEQTHNVLLRWCTHVLEHAVRL